jgi:cysteine synthase
MKKLLLMVGFILMLLVSCTNTNTNNKITITTDQNSYNPSIPSAHGITMAPSFETKSDGEENLIYHWQTTEGEFIGIGKEVRNQDESSVVWSTNPNDTVTATNKTFDIKLEVIGCESKKVLATTKLTITSNNGSYEVKK